MVKRYLTFGLIAVCLVLIVLFFSRGLVHNTVPDVNSVWQQFCDNREDIETIVDFMITSGYSNIYIQDASGIMVADLENVHISDAPVSDAVNRILENYIMINKVGNTIWFLQWRSAQDIGCGIAYTINGTSRPEIEFATELISISEDGWFYYVSDYNKWRTECKE